MNARTYVRIIWRQWSHPNLWGAITIIVFNNNIDEIVLNVRAFLESNRSDNVQCGSSGNAHSKWHPSKWPTKQMAQFALVEAAMAFRSQSQTNINSNGNCTISRSANTSSYISVVVAIIRLNSHLFIFASLLRNQCNIKILLTFTLHCGGMFISTNR